MAIPSTVLMVAIHDRPGRGAVSSISEVPAITLIAAAVAVRQVAVTAAGAKREGAVTTAAELVILTEVATIPFTAAAR